MNAVGGLLLALLLTVPMHREEVATAPRLSLSEALAEARRANALLPVADAQTRLAAVRLREVQAQRGIALRGEGELWLAPQDGYDTTVTDQGAARLQIIGEKTVFDGGALWARERQARADLGSARARYRQAVADVDRQVRETFAAVLAAQGERDIRIRATQRLQHWLDLLEQQARSGEPTAAASLALRVRLAGEEAARSDAEGRLQAQSVALAVLLGRPPDDALDLLPPPLPEAVAAEVELAAPPGTAPVVPDLEAARHETEAAAAALKAARAQRLPRVQLRADAGLWGALVATKPGATFADRLRRDLGASLTLSVQVPLFGTGGLREQIAAARLDLEAARRQAVQASAEVAGLREQAQSDLRHAAESYRLLSTAEATARDALLDAESRYWGGRSGYLEILDAHAALVDTAVAESEALLTLRTAKARLERWGAGS